MKGLETGKDKIQKICDSLKKETLDPARQEAREIVENAHMQAAEVVGEAKLRAEKLIQAAEKEIEQKERVSQASLNLACRQGIELLKQKIEKELFNRELASMVVKEMANPKVIADILNGLMKSMEGKGLEEDFVVKIPKSISPRAITSLLSVKVMEHLEGKPLVVSDFEGGLQVQLKDHQITIDISDSVVRELIAQYIRRDLRDLVFNV